MTIQRPNYMKTLRQGSVSISLSWLLDLAAVLARRPARAPCPSTDSDRLVGTRAAEQLLVFRRARVPTRRVQVSGSQTMPRRVARFSPGHHTRVSLSPVSAISDMVAPVVLITLATIFSNGLLAVSTNIANNVDVWSRERLGILRGPGGEMLDEDSVPPVDRERLMQIREQMPLVIRRVERIRSAVLIIWIAIGLFMLSVGAIAVAVTADSEGFAFTALALVMAGVAGLFVGIASLIVPASRSAEALIHKARRTGSLR